MMQRYNKGNCNFKGARPLVEDLFQDGEIEGLDWNIHETNWKKKPCGKISMQNELLNKN